jgi:hypothetical protein
VYDEARSIVMHDGVTMEFCNNEVGAVVPVVAIPMGPSPKLCADDSIVIVAGTKSAR